MSKKIIATLSLVLLFGFGSKNSDTKKEKQFAQLSEQALVCQTDEDCIIWPVNGCSTVCDPCASGDVSQPPWESMSKEWCQQQRKVEKARKVAMGEAIMCSMCSSSGTNEQNLRARCVENKCQKIKKEETNNSLK